MINSMKRNEKGIAMITLVITVIILVVITSTLAKNSYDSLQLSNLTNLENDIKSLENRIAAYFVEHGELPIYGEAYSKGNIRNTIKDLSPNDGDNYYTIDLSELENITLNYGQNYMSLSTDSYIINEESHAIYYLKGVMYEGKEYHTVGKYTSTILDY